VPPAALLTFAILLEVAATLALRESNGFTRVLPSLAVIAGYSASFFLISLTLKDIPVSVTYAIWAGSGTALVAVAGFVAYGESVTILKVVALVLIISGVAYLGGTHS
jgi:small multidrug resistance pump